MTVDSACSGGSSSLDASRAPHDAASAAGRATAPSARGPARRNTIRAAAIAIGLGALALAVSACSGAGSAGGPQTRQVLIDYVHDEVASSFLLYFPRNVTVHAGDTIDFRQAWTGEPHSVTMGTLVDDMLNTLNPLFEEYGDLPLEEIPPEVEEEAGPAFDALPWMYGDDPDQLVNQNAAQPCYRRDGGPPEDPATPCPPEDQEQPPFDHGFSYYNSGFIPYEGERGNRFTVELAEDIEPGEYWYYCNLHGPFMSGRITVVDDDEPIPTQAEVSAQARAEIDEVAQPLLTAFEDARQERVSQFFGQPVSPPFAGMMVEEESAVPSVNAFVSEFIPENLQVRAGEPVEWTFIGPHTVSFQVPEYFSQMTVEDDGTVIVNPDAIQPVNGPGYPEPEMPPEGEGPPDGEDATGDETPADGDGPPDEEQGPPEPVTVDAGEWDGREFISSGVFWEGTYTLTFTEPGTYPYACLIHPQMVGVVTVEE